MARLRGQKKRQQTRRQIAAKMERRTAQSFFSASERVVIRSFNEYKRRKKETLAEGIRVNSLLKSEHLFNLLGIDSNKENLTKRDIRKLKNGRVLEHFLQDTLSTRLGRQKVQNEIADKIMANKKGKVISNRNALMLADIFQSDLYYTLAEIGDLSSDDLIDIANDSLDDLTSEDVESALDTVLSKYVGREIKSNEIYMTLRDLLI